MVDKEKIRISLLLAEDILVGDKIKIKQPKVQDIMEIGYYNFMVGAYFFYNPKDVCIESEELYGYFEENKMDSYSVLSYIIDSDENVAPIVNNFLKLHVHGKVDIKDGKIFIDGEMMSRDCYDDICVILKNCYDFQKRLEEEKYDETSMIFKIRNIRKKRKVDRKRSSDKNDDDSALFSMLSVILTKKEYNEITDMTMYQLVNYYKTINNEKMYEALLSGIYNGNIDSKHYKNLWSDGSNSSQD